MRSEHGSYGDGDCAGSPVTTILRFGASEDAPPETVVTVAAEVEGPEVSWGVSASPTTAPEQRRASARDAWPAAPVDDPVIGMSASRSAGTRAGSSTSSGRPRPPAPLGGRGRRRGPRTPARLLRAGRADTGALPSGGRARTGARL